MKPAPPFIAVDKSGDVYLYKGETDLRSDLEIVDVENGEYRIFDSSGAILHLFVRNVLAQERPWYLGGQKWRKVVSIQESIGPSAPEELRGILNKMLDYQPSPPSDRPADLSGLIQLAVKTLGYSP